MIARTPDLSCIWSELTSKPRRESISSWFRMRSAAPPPLATAMVSAPASAAGMSFSRASSAMMNLLNDHLLEQDVVHAIGRGGGVDPAGQVVFYADADR